MARAAPLLVRLLLAAAVALAAAAGASADEVHIRSVSSVRLPLVSSIALTLRLRGASRTGVDGRLRAAMAALEAGVGGVGGLPPGSVGRDSSAVEYSSFRNEWTGSAEYTIRAPAQLVYAVLRAADAMNKNVVSYINVNFEVERTTNTGGVNAGFLAASTAARAEATAYLSAVGRKLGPLLGTQSFDNSQYLSSYNPLLETTVKAQYGIQLP